MGIVQGNRHGPRSPRGENTPRALVGAVDPIDPSTMTVAEVIDYLTEHPDQGPHIEQLERAGKARVTLLDHLTTG
jgi:hypothetical protein